MEVFTILAVVVGFAALVGALAARKGYNFFIWFFAAGIIGLVVLAFLPYTNKGMEPREAARKRTTGNTIGGVLAAISVGFLILRLLY